MSRNQRDVADSPSTKKAWLLSNFRLVFVCYCIGQGFIELVSRVEPRPEYRNVFEETVDFVFYGGLVYLFRLRETQNPRDYWRQEIEDYLNLHEPDQVNADVDYNEAMEDLHEDNEPQHENLRLGRIQPENEDPVSKKLFIILKPAVQPSLVDAALGLIRTGTASYEKSRKGQIRYM